MGARGSKPTPVHIRVLRRVLQDQNDCWIWQGYIDKNTGYGKVTANKGEGTRGRTVSCHVVMYEHFNGPIPAGLQVDHLCRVRACCNPLHLEAVPPKINAHRGQHDRTVASLANVCLKGHALVGDNAVPSGRGYRRCRICRDEWMALNRHRYSPVSV